VHRAGEGEALFGGRIVLKCDLEQLCVTESRFDSARDGAAPHIHHEHADSFYVLDGELGFLVRDAEHTLVAGGCVSAPPEVVHGFRSLSPTRFLNFHTPDRGFANSLRARNRGEEGGFDSVDAETGTAPPASVATLFGPGDGERLESGTRVATIKIGTDEIALIEFELEPSFQGPAPHVHDDHVDAFSVLEGDVQFQFDDETMLLGPGSFVAAPLGQVHTFSSGPRRSRVLNIHAPSVGFHDWLRQVND
jgi:quercetin dioxygenase-like cupin family protein